jgi:stearoyl-CoA desaturase (delta-9 desaturase)
LPAAPRRPRFVKRAIKRTILWMNLLPFVVLHLAVLTVFFVPVSWECVSLFLGFFLVRTWGLTGGFHRYFSHRAYKTSRIGQFIIGCIGSSALQKGPMWWAAEHRQHHKYSDKDGDPHSPIVKNLWWSHVGWVLDRSNRFTKWDELKDWHAYPELKWLDRLHFVPGLIVAAICYLAAGWPGVVWGFVLSTVCLYHTTFCVNSFCHIFGYRRFQTTDQSKNNWWVAVLTLGEGWHNNHHHYPSCARQGFAWYEVDVTYYVLRGLGVFGLVWDIREPTPRALKRHLIQSTVDLRIQVGTGESSLVQAGAK